MLPRCQLATAPVKSCLQRSNTSRKVEVDSAFLPTTGKHQQPTSLPKAARVALHGSLNNPPNNTFRQLGRRDRQEASGRKISRASSLTLATGTQSETQRAKPSYRGCKTGYGGPAYYAAERVESGPVTRAVPRLLNAVPGNNATEVWANGRMFV